MIIVRKCEVVCFLLKFIDIWGNPRVFSENDGNNWNLGLNSIARIPSSKSKVVNRLRTLNMQLSSSLHIICTFQTYNMTFKPKI